MAHKLAHDCERGPENETPSVDLGGPHVLLYMLRPCARSNTRGKLSKLIQHSYALGKHLPHRGKHSHSRASRRIGELGFVFSFFWGPHAGLGLRQQPQSASQQLACALGKTVGCAHGDETDLCWWQAHIHSVPELSTWLKTGYV